MNSSNHGAMPGISAPHRVDLLMQNTYVGQLHFRKFSDLPNEVQIKIWTEAMLDTEVLQFDAVQTRKKINNPSAFGTDEEVDGVEITYVFNPISFASMAVSKDSRKHTQDVLTLKHWIPDTMSMSTKTVYIRSFLATHRMFKEFRENRFNQNAVACFTALPPLGFVKVAIPIDCYMTRNDLGFLTGMLGSELEQLDFVIHGDHAACKSTVQPGNLVKAIDGNQGILKPRVLDLELRCRLLVTYAVASQQKGRLEDILPGMSSNILRWEIREEEDTGHNIGSGGDLFAIAKQLWHDWGLGSRHAVIEGRGEGSKVDLGQRYFD